LIVLHGQVYLTILNTIFYDNGIKLTGIQSSTKDTLILWCLYFTSK